ncbi:MAG: ATP-dependent zinc protease [Gammaproteobacteria bacterium]|nr:ATP-dependent zinc protease [Gammaproteobacteria bacterium]
MTTAPKKKRLPKIGWYEWVTLPGLGLPPILAKIDTGAKTSALHAFRLDFFEENGIKKVSFSLHPYPHSTEAFSCEAEIYDYRNVTDSGGHTEKRYVIKTPVHLGKHTWPIEITLTNRDNMSFLMLLGRSALRRRFLINPARKCLFGHPPSKITIKDPS